MFAETRHLSSATPVEEQRSRLGPRGMRFAVLAHPTVQLVRFGTKIVLANLVAHEVFGEVMFAGLMIQLACLVAYIGLDDAVVFAKKLDRGLWSRFRRTHHLTGLFMAGISVIVGYLVPIVRPDFPNVDVYMLALAPTIWASNLSILPSALMIRQRAYRSVFLVDVYGVISLAVVTLSCAHFGLGGWSMIYGWYASGIAVNIAAHILARPFIPKESDGSEDYQKSIDYGTTMAGAKLLGFFGERLDTFVVGFGFGAKVTGHYEIATHIGGFLTNFTTSLGERWLFPVLAAQDHEDGRRPIGLAMIRFTNTFLLPAYILMAVSAPSLIGALFAGRPEWRDAAPLLALVSLSFAVRCPDIVAATALKAAGMERVVLNRSLLTLALLLVIPTFALRWGPAAVAGGVAVARGIGGFVTVCVALKRLKLLKGEPKPALRTGTTTLALWCLTFLPSAYGIRQATMNHPWTNLIATACAALSLWVVIRVLLERATVAREWRFLLERLGRGASAS